MRCTNCDAELETGANFCSNCGRELRKPFVPDRKQTTVLICDFVDSTGLVIDLGEEANEVFEEARARIRKVIHRHRGDADRFYDRVKSGDSLLFCFGLVGVQEDGAERAVRAALDAVSAVENLRIKPGVTVRIRAGIATGMVFPSEEQITGEPAILAARLHEATEPSSVLICSETKQRIGDMFYCVDLGQRTLKGFRAPKQVWRVEGERHIENRFEAMHPEESLTPLVGREEEIGYLLKHWELAREGQGQVALVSGEAGIGKSRVLREVYQRLRMATRILRMQCSSYHVNSAFSPIADSLQRLLQFTSGDSNDARLDKLEAFVAELDGQPEDIQKKDIRLIAPILSLSAEQRHGELVLSQAEKTKNTVQAIVKLIAALAADQPLLMLFEDAHWADPSTLAVLGGLVHRVWQADLKLFVVISYRADDITNQAEFARNLQGHTDVARLALKRLGRSDSGSIVSLLAAGNGLQTETMQEIVSRAGGIPLFLEEVTKLMLEPAGNHDATHPQRLPLAPPTIPQTLRDSLSKRLERLPLDARSTAQAGATIGREFSYDMLLAVGTPTFLSKGAIDRALDSLIASGLVFVRGSGSAKVYSFKHALIQDVARDELGQKRRKELHSKIARTLESSFIEAGRHDLESKREAPVLVRDEPELVAHHYTEAGEYEKAVEYWKLAGDRAARRSANQESIAHLEKGQTLLELCADGPGRKRQQLELYATLLRAYIADTGYTSKQVAQTLSRAEALFPDVTESTDKFVVLRAACQRLLVMGEYESARGLGLKLAQLAQQEDNSGYRLDADLMLGLVCLYRGNFQEASERLTRCTEQFDSVLHLDHAIRQGVDIGSAAWAYLARTTWFLGYPDTALKQSLIGADTKTPSIPLGIAQATFMLALTHYMRGEVEAARMRLEETRSYAEKQGHKYYIAACEVITGSLNAVQERTPASVEQVTRSIAHYLALNSTLGLSSFLLLKANALRLIGEYDQGLRAIDDAAAHMTRTGEAHYAAEIDRVKGELLLARSGGTARAEAEQCFQTSLAIAQQQRAKSFELRTCISIARLHIANGEGSAAHDVLTKICDWFRFESKEGLGTADFKQADLLLQELEKV